MRLVLVGPPGSGKGTQGPAVAERLGVPYLSTGDLLRAEVAAGSDLGRRVSDVLDRGELVPDDLMMTVVAAAVPGRHRRAAGGYVLDGFPRTLAQAQLIERAGSPLAPPELAVLVSVPDAVVHDRLRGRAPEGRADDADPAVIDRRLRVYAEESGPLLDHYERRGVLVTVDGDQPPGAVTAAIMAAVGRRRGRA